MTLGSEISISEAFNKTEELSDSTDSLQSFEKHEMSETESGSLSQNFDDDSLRDTSKSDSLQEIIEARKHNFMVQTERRAAAAKERALAAQQKDSKFQIFRAVPVNVVAAPTLSMSVNTSGAERGKSPSSFQTKGAYSETTEKKSYEPKEKEVKDTTSSKALNRALQPRGAESPRTLEVGTKSHDGGAKPRESGLFGKFGSKSTSGEESKSPRGRLAGEIRQFGGSAGLFDKPSPPSRKKIPPKVAPKPARPKPEERQSVKPVSGLSKTLSSWKKTRAVTGPPRVPEPVQQREALKNSIKVLPEDAPPALTEEERRKRAEDELYEKNIRAYNPRLFRLQHKLDTEDSSPQTSPQQQDRQRDSKKESENNFRKNKK